MKKIMHKPHDAIKLLITFLLLSVVSHWSIPTASAVEISLDPPVISKMQVGESDITGQANQSDSVYIVLDEVYDGFSKEYEVLWGETNTPETKVSYSVGRTISSGNNISKYLSLDMDLESGKTYYFKVRSLSSGTTSGWSNVFKYTYNEIAPPAIETVTLSYEPVYYDYRNIAYYVPTLNVTWSSVSTATNYAVQIPTQSGTAQYLYSWVSGTSTALRSSDTINGPKGFVPGETLKIYVKAYSSVNNVYSIASEAYEFTLPTTTINQITIKQKVDGNALNDGNITLQKGSTCNLYEQLSPYNAINQSVKWASSNPSVASVTDGGYVTAISEGTTILTCYSAYGDAFATCKVTVQGDGAGSTPDPSDPINVSVKCGDNATWTLDEAGLLRITGTGAVWNRNDYYSKIMPYRSSVSRVIVDDGITELGEFSFSGFTNLIEVTLPSTLKTIKSYCFEDCAFDTITIPASVDQIEGNIFIGCDKLVEIVVLAENTTFSSKDGVLINDTTHTLVAYPNGKELDTYTVSSGIKHIGSSAFHSNQNIQRIVFPDSLETIGSVAFGYCKSLKELLLPDSVTGIGVSAFVKSGVTYVKLPSETTIIPNSAFYGCSHLSYIVWPQRITTVEINAFNGCSSISNISYTGSATAWNNISISSGNENLLNAEIEWNTTHTHVGGTASCTQRAICSSCGETYGGFSHTYKYVPYQAATCTNVGWKEYEYCIDCDYSTYAELPMLSHNIEKHGAYPADCELEGNSTYYKCTSCNQYFGDAQGEQLIDVSSVVIEPLGHSYSDDTGLCGVCERVKPGYCGRNLTWELSETGVLTISGTGEMWEDHSWDVESVKEVVINAGVTNISSKAFYDCSNLTSITIPKSVVSIGERAFANTALETLVLHSNISLEDKALYGCNLVELTIPAVDILGRLFSWTTSSYTDPNSGAILYKTTYHIPSSLKSVTLTSATSIARTFTDCSNVQTIYLPNTLTGIISDAFSDCSGLTDIYYSGLAEEWAAITTDLDLTTIEDVQIHFKPVAVTGITLSTDAITIETKDTYLLYADIAPENANNTNITWTTSDTGIATVSTSGLVTAISPGVVTITATAEDGGHTATCLVTVTKPTEYKINSISIRDSSGSELTAIPNGSFLATMSITNLASEGDTLVMLASYTSTGQYQGMMWVSVEDLPVGATIKVTLPVDNSDGKIENLKAFTVASFSNLTPLGEAVSFLP